jgi:hypothetical protein
MALVGRRCQVLGARLFGAELGAQLTDPAPDWMPIAAMLP